MVYKEIEPFIEKDVRVVLTDGQIVEGFISNTESEFDTPSGEEEIEVIAFDRDLCYGIPFSDIQSISLQE